MKNCLATLCTVLFALAPGMAAADTGVQGELLFTGTMRGLFSHMPAGEAEPPMRIRLGPGWMGPRPLRATEIVVAAPHVQFGVFLSASTHAQLPLIPLRFVTKFPPPGLVVPGNPTPVPSSAMDFTCQNGYACDATYTFDKPSEMMPGDWMFEVWSGSDLIVSKTIKVVMPEAAS